MFIREVLSSGVFAEGGYRLFKIIVKSTAVIALLLIILSVDTASASETKAGVVKNASGHVFIDRQQISIPANAGDNLFENDVIRTGPDGSIGVIFQDNGVMGIGPNTRVNISKFAFEPANQKYGFIAQITKGTLVYFAGLIAKQKNVRFETPTVSCGIRGTHLAIKVEPADEKLWRKFKQFWVGGSPEN